MIKKADTSKSVKQWRQTIFFPQDNYTIRVLEEEHTTSKSDDPMTILKFEIVNCLPKMIGDEGQIEFDGVQFSTWNLTDYQAKDKENDEEVEKAAKTAQDFFNRYDDFLRKAGHNTAEGWDPAKPPSVLGKVLLVRLYGSAEPAMSSPTPEEKARGERGKPLKNPITGKDVVNYQIKIAEVYGLAKEQELTNRPANW